MEKDKIEELLIEVKTQCAAIGSRMDSILMTLANHENRLMTIEHATQHTEAQDPWKNQLMLLLAKGVVSAVIVIGTLCGAGGALKMIFK